MVRVREYKNISLLCPAQFCVLGIADGFLYIKTEYKIKNHNIELRRNVQVLLPTAVQN